MWTWGGRREALTDTISLPMPSLTVDLRDDGPERRYEVEILFNELGNHYLRLTLAMEEPTPADLHQALRRATIFVGRQDVASGVAKWGSIAEYAVDVITDVVDWITSAAEPEKPDERPGWRTPLRRSWQKAESAIEDPIPKNTGASNPALNYHVVVVINSATLEGVGSNRQATKDEIELAYGPLLLQRFNREATALDEWIGLSKPKAMRNLLGDTRFPSDFAIGTAFTTILYMPSTPNWVRAGYEEIAEFVASSLPLIRQWTIDFDNKLAEAGENAKGMKILPSKHWKSN